MCVQNEAWDYNCSPLKQHKAAIHGIDIVWHACPELGCECRAKENSNIKQHRADLHNIGVAWHECPEPNCSHKTKRRAPQSQYA